VDEPVPARAPPKNLVPRGGCVSTVEQTLSLQPLFLDGAPLALFP
jgi:hypothetical protein